MKHQPHITLWIVLACLLILTQGCAAPPDQDEPIHLTVYILPYMSFLPFHIAQEEGYFAEQGLEVEFVPFERTSDSTAALAQGQLDVGTGILTVSTLNAIAQGADIRFVAERGYIESDGCDQLVLMANETTASFTVDQLAGKSIAAEEETFYGYFISKVLASTDVTMDDLELLVLPRPTLGEALSKGEVDFIATTEPYVTQYLDAGQGVVWASGNDYVAGEQLGVIMFGPSILNDNPDAGKRFMAAYIKAVQVYSEGKTERNLDYMAEFTGLERDLVERACWHVLRSDLQLNIDSVLSFQEWAVGRGYFDGGLTEEDFWDPSFIEYAQSVVNP